MFIVQDMVLNMVLFTGRIQDYLKVEKNIRRKSKEEDDFAIKFFWFILKLIKYLIKIQKFNFRIIFYFIKK